MSYYLVHFSGAAPLVGKKATVNINRVIADEPTVVQEAVHREVVCDEQHVVNDRVLTRQVNKMEMVKPREVRYDRNVIEAGDEFEYTFTSNDLEENVTQFARAIATSEKAFMGSYTAGVYGPVMHIAVLRDRPLRVEASSDTLSVTVVKK